MVIAHIQKLLTLDFLRIFCFKLACEIILTCIIPHHIPARIAARAVGPLDAQVVHTLSVGSHHVCKTVM